VDVADESFQGPRAFWEDKGVRPASRRKAKQQFTLVRFLRSSSVTPHRGIRM
jgi:hypothetical protein